MERLLSLLSSSPEASETLNQFLTYYVSSDRQFADLGEFVLSGNHEYSKLLLGAMEYSIFPHGVRPKLATLAGITSKDTAWDWVTSQIKTFVERDDWMHAQHLPKIAHAFSRIFFTIARAKFPIYLSPERAASLFDMWRIINETRMRRNGWSFLGDDFAAAPPSIQTFRSVAQRNQNRMRKRYLQIINASAASSDMGDDDNIDEEWPITDANLGLPDAIALSLSGLGPYEPTAGKRSRDTMDASSSKSPSVVVAPPHTTDAPMNQDESESSTEEWETNQFGIPIAGWEGRLLDITAADLQNAIDFPLAGWPTYEELYGVPQPRFIKSDESMIRLVAGDPANTTFYRQEDGDPVTRALLDHYAELVPNSDWTTLNEKGRLYPSMEGRPYKIYRLPPRMIKDHPTGDGPFALRLGPQGSGELMQWLDTPSAAPGVRKSSMREVLMLLENPLQIGFPATVNTDACLGFAAYAFQSAEVLFGPVQTTHDILIRLEGRRCKGHSDRQHTTQRAKVGYCPCCTLPTHVAIPLSYVLGEDDRHKRIAMDIWAEWGPLGQRRYAALFYALINNGRQPMPVGWDWAAKTLNFAYPSVLIRGVPNGVPTPILTVDEARRLEHQRRNLEAARPRIRPPPPAILDRPRSPPSIDDAGAGPYPKYIPHDEVKGETKSSDNIQQADVEMEDHEAGNEGASKGGTNQEPAKNDEKFGPGPYPKMYPPSDTEKREHPKAAASIPDAGKSWRNWTSDTLVGRYGEMSPQQPTDAPVTPNPRGGHSEFGPKRESSALPAQSGYRYKGVDPKMTFKGPEHLGWSSPKIPEGKPPISTAYDKSKQAKMHVSSKGMTNAAKNEKQKDGQKGEPSNIFSQPISAGTTDSKSSKPTLTLDSAIPAEAETQKGPSTEDWRGVRRKKQQSPSPKGNTSSNWKSWHGWKQ